MVINLLERSSKTELNQAGYKLSFFDSDFLYNLHKDTAEMKKKIEEFKKLKIRPIVNLLLFAELLNGLDSLNKNYPAHYQNKKLIMRFFDELNALWILSHDEILSFEFVHAYHGNNKGAHDFFKVYCSFPLFVEVGKNCQLLYPCDELMKFSYTPYGIKDFTYEELLYQYVMDLRSNQNTYRSGVDNNNAGKKIIRDALTGLVVNDQNEKNKLIDRKQINEFLANHIEGNREIDHLIDHFHSSPQNHIYLPYTPLYSVQNIISLKYVKEKTRENDFIDSMHARVALSYCDYFITCDQDLKSECQQFTQEMNLAVGFDI